MDLEQQILNTQPAVQNPWRQSTTLSATGGAFSSDADMEYKVKLVEEKDRLLDEKSKLQDRM